jgi:hypothetical protein
LHRSARSWFGACLPRHIARPVNMALGAENGAKYEF